MRAQSVDPKKLFRPLLAVAVAALVPTVAFAGPKQFDPVVTQHVCKNQHRGTADPDDVALLVSGTGAKPKKKVFVAYASATGSAQWGYGRCKDQLTTGLASVSLVASDRANSRGDFSVRIPLQSCSEGNYVQVLSAPFRKDQCAVTSLSTGAWVAEDDASPTSTGSGANSGGYGSYHVHDNSNCQSAPIFTHSITLGECNEYPVGEMGSTAAFREKCTCDGDTDTLTCEIFEASDTQCATPLSSPFQDTPGFYNSDSTMTACTGWGDITTNKAYDDPSTTLAATGGVSTMFAKFQLPKGTLSDYRCSNWLPSQTQP